MAVVGLGAIGFVLEVFNMLEYIKGTRLALIRYDPKVAAGLVIMSLMRLLLLYSKVEFETHVDTDSKFSRKLCTRTQVDVTRTAESRSSRT